MSDKTFEDVLKWRSYSQKDNFSALGDVVQVVMRDQVDPRHEKLSQLNDTWGKLLPPLLAENCKIDSLTAGTLKVVANSSSYMYEMRLCSHLLLEQIQKRCPKARVNKIKIVIG